MSYELIWEPHGVVKRFFGVLTGRDIVESVERIEADPRFDACRHVINDLLAVERVDVSATDVEYVAAIDRGAALTNPDIRVAFVTTSPRLVALAEQYAEGGQSAYPTRIFDALVVARAWATAR